jgi:hypothetical protein
MFINYDLIRLIDSLLALAAKYCNFSACQCLTDPFPNTFQYLIIFS